MTQKPEASSQEETVTVQWILVSKAETDTSNSQERRISGISTSKSRENNWSMKEDLCLTLQEEKTRTTNPFSSGRSTMERIKNGRSTMER